MKNKNEIDAYVWKTPDGWYAQLSGNISPDPQGPYPSQKEAKAVIQVSLEEDVINNEYAPGFAWFPRYVNRQP